MTIESKIIITAEDRSRAAFASIERNTHKTTTALTRLTSSALRLAGVSTLLVFFKKNAEATDRWSDEMTRLNDVTQKYFNTVANADHLDPLINGLKTVYSGATGATIAMIKLAEGVAAFGRDVKLLFTDFRQSGREMAAWKESVDQAHAAQIAFDKSLFEAVPSGYAKHREEEAERVKNAAKKLKVAEEERLQAVLDHARPAEDAIRAEMEISEGQSAPGLTKVGETVFDEARAKESEKEAAEKERLQRTVERIQESFLTEKMLEEAQYEEKKQILMDRRTEELFGKEEQDRLLEDLELEHQARMGDANAKGVLARRRFEEMSAKQKTDFILADMLRMTQGVAASNKAMFQINRLATIANIALGTPQAVQQAFNAYPPPFSFVAAGLQLAASLANLNQAKNAQFGTSTSAPNVGGGGAVPVTDVGGGLPDLSPTTKQPPQRQINLYVQSDSGMVSMRWLIDRFIPTFNEALGDGVHINVVP